jgi:hypothetical protein
LKEKEDLEKNLIETKEEAQHLALLFNQREKEFHGLQNQLQDSRAKNESALALLEEKEALEERYLEIKEQVKTKEEEMKEEFKKMEHYKDLYLTHEEKYSTLTEKLLKEQDLRQHLEETLGQRDLEIQQLLGDIERVVGEKDGLNDQLGRTKVLVESLQSRLLKQNELVKLVGSQSCSDCLDLRNFDSFTTTTDYTRVLESRRDIALEEPNPVLRVPTPILPPRIRISIFSFTRTVQENSGVEKESGKTGRRNCGCSPKNGGRKTRVEETVG